MDINYRPETIETRTVYSGKRISVRVDTVDCEGTNVVREVVEHPGAVAILPIHEDGSISFIKQYRHAPDSVLFEVPAGTLESGEDPFACAERELAEEAKLQAKNWLHLGVVLTTPGFSTEKIHLFAAQQLSSASADRDIGEYMEIHRIPLSKVFEMILSSEICDAKSLSCCMSAVIKGIIKFPGVESLNV